MVYAKKSLGQHFLRSERALDEIINAGDLKKEDIVLEIGPGQGVLTERLLARVGKVIAVEKDDALTEFLRGRFFKEINESKLDLIHGDILEFDPENFENYNHHPYKIIANIPYNITGAIFEKFLSAHKQPESMVLLVQDEVAKRAVARDGKESILSISVKAYGIPRYVDRVLAGSFVPAPNVNSAIISIEHISKTFFRNFSEADFFKLLKTGFQSKRKKLSSNLSNEFDKEKVLGAFKKFNLNENTRAEDLPLNTWQALAAEILN